VLDLPADILDAMIEHARVAAPEECCGLIVGRAGIATRCIPLRNELGSPVAYRADSRDLFHAFRSIRDEHLELMAIYHSHPTSPALPSRVDLAENYYGDVPRIIISLASEPPDVRAFRLHAGAFEELAYHWLRQCDIPHTGKASGT
jgi:proteasome lid subunit RPN8/RPN11